ncbi:hypothetical protein RQP46_001383 [Phenoliferia psychrophenolica]
MTTIYPDLPDILVTVDSEGIALLTLNRPDARNAFTGEMRDSLVQAYSRLDKDNAVKVIVTCGAPNKGNAFCAGADLKKGDFNYANTRNLNEHRDGGGQTSLATFKVAKPTICALNGHAIGIGITMALTFDIRLAWKDAKVGFVFGKRGIVPEAVSSYFLPKLIGHSRALELFMTSRILPASSPTLDLLFSSVHDSPAATVTAALALASEIARNNSAISMAVTKALVWRPQSTPEEQHLLDSKAVYTLGKGADSKEGVKAFKEKREANFPARVPRDLPTEYYPWWVEADIKSKL